MAVKRFRWLGGVVPGKGVLHVRVSDVVTTYGPGDIVERPEHIAELGDKRIADLIASGSAEAVNFIEGKLNVVREIPGAMTDQEKAQTQAVVQEVVAAHAPQQAAAAAKKRNQKEAGEVPEQAPPLVASVAGPSRSR